MTACGTSSSTPRAESALGPWAEVPPGFPTRSNTIAITLEAEIQLLGSPGSGSRRTARSQSPDAHREAGRSSAAKSEGACPLNQMPERGALSTGLRTESPCWVTSPGSSP